MNERSDDYNARWGVPPNDVPAALQEQYDPHHELVLVLIRERDMLRAETDHLKRLLIAITDERDTLRAELRTCQETLTACLETH